MSATTSAARLPGPAGRWLAGNLQDYEDDRLGFLTRARREFGPLVRFDRHTTIVSDPALAREVLRSLGGRFQITENFLQRRLSPSEIGSVLEARALLNPGLRRSAVPAIAPEVAAAVRDVMRPHGRHGTPVDPVPLMEQVTSRVVSRYYFGDDGAHLPPLVGSLLDALSEVIGNPFALPAFLGSPARRRITRRHLLLRGQVVDLLVPRDRGDLGDVASGIVAAARAKGHFTLERLADLIIGAMLAAHRVPAASASWLLMCVADHPWLEGQVLDEAARMSVDPSDGGHDPRRSPHAMACVLETLRLYPTTWLLSRVSSTPLSLGGWSFPAGHHFLISPYVIGRDEANYRRATEYDPSRWLDGRPAPSSFLSFGFGPHACPGNDFATCLLTTTLLAVVERWRVEREPGQVRPDPRTTLLPAGLRLRFTARGPAEGGRTDYAVVRPASD